jgi:GT2 family glycosyltransferase
MMASPLSIVIPTYNRADLLHDCLDSVTEHAPEGTEVIVVDDASPGEAVAEVAGRFSSVRRIRLLRRSGFCVAANTGIAASKAPIIELLNDDTQVMAGWADAPLAAFADPTVAAVAPLSLRADGLIDSAGDEYDRGGFAFKRGHGEAMNEQYQQSEPVTAASGSCAFYRRTFLDLAGYFPETFGAYFDDVDLSLRLQRAGGTILFEPASRVIHRGGASYGPLSRKLIERQSCNEERLYWRNTPSREFLGTLPRHAAVLVSKAMRRWAFGRLRAWAEILERR